jgi:cation transport ATPase
VDFNTSSDNQIEKVTDEVYSERQYPSRQEARREMEEKRINQRFMGTKKKKTEEEGEGVEYSPTRSKSKSSKKRIKVGMPRVKLVLKILAVVAVFFNFKFILNFMKDPISPFYHTLIVVGICVAINFIAVWILFYKSAFMRFYLSLFAILGSFGYYFYINYTYQSFLGNNLISSVLVIISVLMAVNPKLNYYLKSCIFLLVPIIGIYLSGNKFALVWTLMFNAGLILFFRVSKSKEKEARTRRNQKQSA